MPGVMSRHQREPRVERDRDRRIRARHRCWEDLPRSVLVELLQRMETELHAPFSLNRVKLLRAHKNTLLAGMYLAIRVQRKDGLPSRA